jgi:TP901 family phage tail tape measure protein
LATDVGKLGVAVNEVPKYTEVLVKLATATDKLDKLDELGKNVAKIGTVFKFSIKDVEEYGAAVNKLDDISSATSDEIINFTKRVSGVAAVSKLSAREVAAWGATLISSGQAPNVAATFMNKFLTVLGAAENLGDKAQNAIGNLGLEPHQLSMRFDKNGSKTMIDFLERVKKLSSIDQRYTLGAIFGQEHIDSAMQLVQVYDKLIPNIKQANDITGNIAKVNKEFELLANASLEGQMNTLKNQFVEIGKTLGLTLIPSIVSINKHIVPMLNGFLAFSKTHPEIMKVGIAVLGITAAILPLSAAINGVVSLGNSISIIAGVVIPFGTWVIGGLIPGLISLGSAVLPGIIASLGGIAVAVWTATAPLLPFIAAIGAVAGGAYLIYTNWANIGTFFTNLWEGAKQGANNFGIFLVDLFINTLGSETLDNLTAIFTNVGNITIGLINAIGNAWSTFMGNFSNEWNTRVNNVRGVWVSATDIMANATNKVGVASNSVLMTIGTGVFNTAKYALSVLDGWSKSVYNAMMSVGKVVYDWFVSFGTNAYNWGRDLIGNFAQGIKDNIQNATSAVAEMTSQIGQYLPHSPAEKGALSDLDKRGQYFTDTFLDGINGSGLTNFLNGVLSTPQASPVYATQGNSQSQTPIQIIYSPVITGSKQDSEAILKLLQSKDKDLLEIIDKALKRNGRKFY